MLVYQKLLKALESIGVEPEAFSERFLTKKPIFAEDTCIYWKRRSSESGIMLDLMDLYYKSIGLGEDNLEDYLFNLNKTPNSLGIEYPDVIDEEANVFIRIASKPNVFGDESLLSIFITIDQQKIGGVIVHYVKNTYEEPDEWVQKLREAYVSVNNIQVLEK